MIALDDELSAFDRAARAEKALQCLRHIGERPIILRQAADDRHDLASAPLALPGQAHPTVLRQRRSNGRTSTSSMGLPQRLQSGTRPMPVT